MKFKELRENGIEIALSGEELQELDITYDELDYSNIETRRVLWTILDEAREALGRDINLAGKMLIEAQSDGKGGCIIDFTLLPGETAGARRLVKKEPQPVVLETDDIDALLAAMRACPQETSPALYTKDGDYRLLLFPAAPEREGLLLTMTEFGRVLTEEPELAVAQAEEMWSKIQK